MFHLCTTDLQSCDHVSVVKIVRHNPSVFLTSGSYLGTTGALTLQVLHVIAETGANAPLLNLRYPLVNGCAGVPAKPVLFPGENLAKSGFMWKISVGEIDRLWLDGQLTIDKRLKAFRDASLGNCSHFPSRSIRSIMEASR
jgi:hypothetical protein